MSILDRQATVAPPGYNRWLVPPAALAIHLAIGQVYSLSVFKNPLIALIPTDKPGEGANWTETQLLWIFSIAIAVLGASAAIFGKWVERSGPRKSMIASGLCFGGGFAIGALGVHLHQLSIVYFGYGVVGGIGLGLGYIAPVSTLVKWFPDRPGMATGLAIMGFGGGGLVGSNLAQALMDHFKSATEPGVAPTFLWMGLIYLVAALFGALIVRVPAADWKPAGFDPSRAAQGHMITTKQVALEQAWRTPQFWLLWVVLCFNVTAGIGILEGAAPMIQTIFPPRFPRDTAAHIAASTAAAGGFVTLLSLFNMLGRFVWSSASDLFGRKVNYVIYLLLGAVGYASLPTISRAGNVTAFVLVCVVLLSMYGGGFATIPAYLKDLFGTMNVGAIHGRLLTAWSVAGVLGPYIVNHIRDHEVANGAKGADKYALCFYVMSGLLLIGLVCNLLVRNVSERYHFRGVDETIPQGVPTSQATPYAPTSR